MIDKQWLLVVLLAIPVLWHRLKTWLFGPDRNWIEKSMKKADEWHNSQKGNGS